MVCGFKHASRSYTITSDVMFKSRIDQREIVKRALFLKHLIFEASSRKFVATFLPEFSSTVCFSFFLIKLRSNNFYHGFVR